MLANKHFCRWWAILSFMVLHAGTGFAAEFEPYEDSAGKVVRHATEESHPYLFRGKEVKVSPHEEHREKYISSIKQFSSVLDCLTKEARKQERPDLTKVDWRKIDTNEDAAVCLFRIASSYATPKDMEKWMKAQGFRTLYVGSRGDRGPAVGGSWSVSEHGVKFSAHWLDKWWLNTTSYGTSFSVSYDKGGVAYKAAVTHTFK